MHRQQHRVFWNQDTSCDSGGHPVASRSDCSTGQRRGDASADPRHTKLSLHQPRCVSGGRCNRGNISEIVLRLHDLGRVETGPFTDRHWPLFKLVYGTTAMITLYVAHEHAHVMQVYNALMLGFTGIDTANHCESILNIPGSMLSPLAFIDIHRTT